MAQLALAVAGSYIGGSLITGTVLGLTGSAIGWTAGALLGSALFPQQSYGPRLGDLRVSGTEYGQTIPWVAGGPRISGQIIWASEKREIENTQSVGKGGGSEVTSYTYEVDVMIMLTENPIRGIGRVWLNSELVVIADNGLPPEGSLDSGTSPAEFDLYYNQKNEFWESIAIYTGTADQLPDPTYEAAVGVGNAPAYRGRGYVVIRSLQLGSSGQIPNLTFEISTATAGPGNGILYAPLNSTYEADDLFAPELNPLATDGGATAVFTDALTITKSAVGDSYIFQYLDFQAPIADQKISPNLYPGEIVTYAVDFSNITLSAGGTGGTTQTRLFYIRDEVTFQAEFNINSLNEMRGGFPGGFGENLALAPYTPGMSGTMAIEIRQDDDLINFYLNDTLFQSLSSSINVLSRLVIGLVTSAGSKYPNSITFSNLRVFRGAYLNEVTVVANTEMLDAVATKLLERAGYESTEYDVSDLTSVTKPVRGMALGQVAPTRGALETLQTAFFIYAAKSDKIYLRSREASPIVDIPFEDLGASNSATDTSEPLALTIGSELELPAQISLSYNNTLADYNISTEHSDRLLSSQESNQVVNLGLGMQPAEAKGIADAMLIDQLSSLTRSTIRLPLKYAYLEPGDVFTVNNLDGRQYRFRSITKRDMLTMIEHECVVDDQTALLSAEITSEDYTSSTTIRQIAPTSWEAMDIPLLRDADNSAGYYAAITPDRASDNDEWPGGVFMRAWSQDAFEQLFTSGNAAAMGVCTSTLGNFEGGSARFDESNSLTVQITGQLSSTTRDEMLDDLSLNAALVGNEIVRFRFAEFLGTVDGKNEYRLTSFVRGQRGTEQHIGSHVADERFVLLNNAIRRVQDTTSEIGVASEVKAVTLNALLSSVTAEAFTDTGVSLKPFSVANLRALANGSDLDVTWQRRTRLAYVYGGTIGASVPLGETTESYRIDIYDGPTLVNTYTTTDAEFTYTAAQIAADGFASTDPITITVRQVSEIVGPGFPATIESAAP